MGSREKLCLRWNDFEANISSAFRSLGEEKDFTDVTLACGENQVEAHKVILAASSPFFKRILKKNPHSHPLIYLKGIKFSDVEAVLTFIYQGEVNVEETNLNTFLEVAQELEVKGLGSGKKDHHEGDSNMQVSRLAQGRNLGDVGSNLLSSVSRSNVQSLAGETNMQPPASNMQSLDQMYDQLYSQTMQEIATPVPHTVDNNNTNKVVTAKLELGESPEKESVPVPVLEGKMQQNVLGSHDHHQEQCSQVY